MSDAVAGAYAQHRKPIGRDSSEASALDLLGRRDVALSRRAIQEGGGRSTRAHAGRDGLAKTTPITPKRIDETIIHSDRKIDQFVSVDGRGRLENRSVDVPTAVDPSLKSNS